jgi:hypothetical protein
MAYGVNAHSGRDPAERFLNVFRWLSRNFNYEKFILIEYDMLILKDVVVINSPFSCHSDVNKEGYRFKHYVYYPPPWIFSHSIATSIWAMGNSLLKFGDCEEGYNDRFMARILNEIGLKPSKALEVHHGYFDKDPEAKQKALVAVKAGTCTFLHCVKTQADLDYFGL